MSVFAEAIRLDLAPLCHVCGAMRRIERLDENDNRIRTVERCDHCRRRWYGCRAKRLDAEGRALWGPPGEWRFSEAPP